ncbi:CPBP family glutamic-type intramembrane protease [Thalassoglobus polymorphus]|uniref:CAAX amino terminal protease self-immunity n=1 Tax=Thalassoglobus polymorphus TaxID=2527994 RepID=A0A517QUH4_9PLAN|nr:CPBP family glutamic-type intramembrane protease [Thalassoglobus polymorphus]QDT35264.1 CAAX amino terminal protease self- immunity [Thalassoglobus polymorphus]
MFPQEQSHNDYWSTAREPWPSLLFILPFLIVYEVGAIAHAHVPASRNGADLWIRHFGMETGVAVEWMFPLLAPILLLIWQFAARRPWNWNLETLSGMFAESLMFAMTLVVIGQVTALAFPLEVSVELSVTPLSRAVSFLGAGIYEEMLFRLTMLPLIFAALRVIRLPRSLAIFGSIMISSWLFATAHYVGSPALFSPDELTQAMTTVCESRELWFSYTFRFMAGILFSILFWVRGFGIAVGCHILYDLFVGVILAGIG